MAKLIKKSKCTFEEGYIIKNGKQIGLPFIVWAQLNELEIMMQEHAYLKAQPTYQPGPSLEGFERKSAFTKDRPYVDAPDTPVTDKRVAEALAFIDESEKVENAATVNNAIDKFGALIDWAASKKFIEDDCYTRIDTPSLGNPLELTPEAIVSVLRVLIEDPAVCMRLGE